MRVLIVANHNTGHFVPFIVEQVEALIQLGVECEYFGVHGKGISGYLSNLGALKTKIREYRPDLIHAHYGLSGLLANLQRDIPVVTTFHGSDIHSKGRNLLFSRLTMRLSAYNIFVTEYLKETAGYHSNKQCVLPCGINTTTFFQIEQKIARKQLGWDSDGTYVLFAGAFDNKVKNSPLAKAAISQINSAELIEMRGFTREQVNLAMNAANCLLMTSFREGSPQVIKEALACGTPIVSVNVGDVADVVSGIEGCYITSYDTNDVVSGLNKAISFQYRTKGRERIIQRMLSNEQISKKILTIYEGVKKVHN